MNEVAWSGLVEFAKRTQLHPRDEEARVRLLAAARQVREALARAAAGEEWVGTLAPALEAGAAKREQPGVVDQRAARWFLQRAEVDEASLRGAVAGFLDARRDPVAPVAALAEAAVRSPAPDDRPNAIVALGALFNFAASGGAQPPVRPSKFGRLERLLGAGEAAGAPAERYAVHLEFAAQVRDRVVAGGGLVRDMLDVGMLLERARRYEPAWSSGLQLQLDPIPAVEPARLTATSGGPVYLAACALYRDEAPYLREWVEFHRLVGVERFFLYDHESVDDHLTVLAPYIDAGIVEVQRPPGSPPQAPAYRNCLERHRTDARWIAFIDIDEFLFSPTGKAVSELLREYERWPGVGVNWALFGSSGHRERQPGLVIESYLFRTLSPDGERTIKSVVQPERVLDFNDAHSFRYDDGYAVDERKRAIDSPPFWSSGRHSTERLRLNHYTTKSEAVFPYF
jgi:hypothetical protein